MVRKECRGFEEVDTTSRYAVVRSKDGNDAMVKMR
jgi:hypothetical protein